MESLAFSWTRSALVHIMAIVEDRAGGGFRPRSVRVVPYKNVKLRRVGERTPL